MSSMCELRVTTCTRLIIWLHNAISSSSILCLPWRGEPPRVLQSVLSKSRKSAAGLREATRLVTSEPSPWWKRHSAHDQPSHAKHRRSCGHQHASPAHCLALPSLPPKGHLPSPSRLSLCSQPRHTLSRSHAEVKSDAQCTQGCEARFEALALSVGLMPDAALL